MSTVFVVLCIRLIVMVSLLPVSYPCILRNNIHYHVPRKLASCVHPIVSRKLSIISRRCSHHVIRGVIESIARYLVALDHFHLVAQKQKLFVDIFKLFSFNLHLLNIAFESVLLNEDLCVLLLLILRLFAKFLGLIVDLRVLIHHLFYLLLGALIRVLFLLAELLSL